MKLGRVVDHGPRINFRIGANRKWHYINFGGHFENDASQISVTEDKNAFIENKYLLRVSF